jgi:hypothetical protein
MWRLHGFRKLKHKIKTKLECSFRFKWSAYLANEKRNAANDKKSKD